MKSLVTYLVYGAQGSLPCEPEDLATCLVSVAERREAREVSARTTGQDRELCVPRSRTDMGKRRFNCHCPVLYNALLSTGLAFPEFSRRHSLATSSNIGWPFLLCQIEARLPSYGCYVMGGDAACF